MKISVWALVLAFGFTATNTVAQAQTAEAPAGAAQVNNTPAAAPMATAAPGEPLVPAATPPRQGNPRPLPTEEKDETPTIGVFIEPILALIGIYEGDLGVAVSRHVTVGFWGQYFKYELLQIGISGYGVGLGSQLFLTKQAFSGLYVYPIVKYQKVDFKSGGQSVANVGFYGPTVTVGYQWNLHPIAFKVGGGLEYSFGKLQSDQVDSSLSFEGFDYELDASIGLVF